MTFLDLARKNASRKPLRSILLIICIAVAFLIYGLTQSFLHGTQGTSGASNDMLGVMSAGGHSQPLPIASLARIAAEPDVAAVGYVARLRGFVDLERNTVSVSAVDPQRLADVSGKDLALTPDLLTAISGARNRVLVGRALADAQGWTTGQSITVHAFDTIRQDGNRDWRFEIAGIFNGENTSVDTYFVIARYDYVNAARARDKDTVNAFIVRPRDGVASSKLAAHIDTLFANSATPTRTQSEKQFLEAYLRQYADIGLIVNLVVGASFVTLLMITVNTMAFAVRERNFEIGVLKTLGFSPATILGLILGETLLIFTLGGGLGTGLATLTASLSAPELGLVFSPLIAAKAVAIIVILGLAIGALPAASAMRTPITKAFTTR